MKRETKAGEEAWKGFEDLKAWQLARRLMIECHKLADGLPAKERYDLIMSRQAALSFKNNQKHIGKTYKVLVEGMSKNKIYAGRTAFQAPEVDGVTYIKSDRLQTGCFSYVKITDALEYDLVGEAA